MDPNFNKMIEKKKKKEKKNGGNSIVVEAPNRK